MKKGDNYKVDRNLIRLRLIALIFEHLNKAISFSAPNFTLCQKWSKLKAFADDNLNVLQQMIYVLLEDENIVGKGENAG